MTKPIRLLIIVLAAVVSAACVPTWTRVDKPEATDPGKAFRVSLPAGWVRSQVFRNGILITRDGPWLNLIEIRRRDHDNAFARIKKSSRADMLPSELAELELADTKKEDPATATAEVLDNRPTTIAGRPGFRLQLRFRNQRGLRVERVVYGFADQSGYYTLTYQAPQLHYFPRDLDAFEHIVAGMQLTGR